MQVSFHARLLLAAACTYFFMGITPALAKRVVPSGENVFKQYCASCHTGGGNLVHEHKPVAGSSKLSSLAVFKAYLQAPPGHMPYYKNVVSDPQLLKALYDYCRSLKPPEQAQAFPVPIADR